LLRDATGKQQHGDERHRGILGESPFGHRAVSFAGKFKQPFFLIYLYNSWFQILTDSLFAEHRGFTDP
jgi:hypothetical protein